MRVYLQLAGIGVCLCSLAAHAQVRARQANDYSTGAGIGQCIAGGCEVFRGTILTDGAKPGEPVSIRVDEALYGMSAPPTTVALPYPGLEGGLRNLAYAWGGVQVARNVRVTVIITTQGGLMSGPGEPALVTSDERLGGVIRTLAEEAAQLDRSPELISGAVASLSTDPNPALAGLLFSRLAFRAIKQPELVGGLLIQMLPNRSVPPEELENIAIHLALTYALLSDDGKAAALRRFTDLGEQSDVPAAKAAYAGLAHIATHFPVRTTIPPATLMAIENNYRALIHKGSITRNKALEAGLGFKAE